MKVRQWYHGLLKKKTDSHSLWYKPDMLGLINPLPAKELVLLMQFLQKFNKEFYPKARPTRNGSLLELGFFWAYMNSWNSSKASYDVSVADGKRFLMGIIWCLKGTERVKQRG